MTEYIVSRNPDLLELLPTEYTSYQKMIKSVQNGSSWLECATLEEYPKEIRVTWFQRGKEWLDLAHTFAVPGMQLEPDFRMWILEQELERAEQFWDLSVHLNQYFES